MSNFCPKQLHRGAHPEMFADTRRGEFRRWLDYEGILDAFTKRPSHFSHQCL
jgi:hypothetical protein